MAFFGYYVKSAETSKGCVLEPYHETFIHVILKPPAWKVGFFYSYGTRLSRDNQKSDTISNEYVWKPSKESIVNNNPKRCIYYKVSWKPAKGVLDV